MAHLWIRWQQNHGNHEEPGHSAWAIANLPDDAGVIVLTDNPRQPVRLGGKGRKDSVVAQIVCIGDGQKETWVLQSGEREKIRVNGLPLVADIQVLENLDELRTKGTGRFYFSTERTPRVEAFQGRAAATPCARCRSTISQGEPTVQCPKCKTWHHESTDMPCWSYSEKCSLCDEETSLDKGLRWTPENL